MPALDRDFTPAFEMWPAAEHGRCQDPSIVLISAKLLHPLASTCNASSASFASDGAERHEPGPETLCDDCRRPALGPDAGDKGSHVLQRQ